MLPGTTAAMQKATKRRMPPEKVSPSLPAHSSISSSARSSRVRARTCFALPPRTLPTSSMACLEVRPLMGTWLWAWNEQACRA